MWPLFFAKERGQSLMDGLLDAGPSYAHNESLPAVAHKWSQSIYDMCESP